MFTGSVRKFSLTLLAVAALGSWGCSDTGHGGFLEPNAPEANLLGGTFEALGGIVETTGGLVGNILGLAVCQPLPELVGFALIGPRGGSLRVGAYELEVPARALSRTVLVSMTQVSGSVNSTRFAPHGLTFAKPATLTMSYRNCDPNPGGGASRILYVSESLEILEAPRSRDNQKASEVEALIDHFSRYAVAW